MLFNTAVGYLLYGDSYRLTNNVCTATSIWTTMYFSSTLFILQLRERLQLLKEKEAEEEENKRTEILEAKQAKDRMLMDTLTVISKHRAEDTRTKAEQ